MQPEVFKVSTLEFCKQKVRDLEMKIEEAKQADRLTDLIVLKPKFYQALERYREQRKWTEMFERKVA